MIINYARLMHGWSCVVTHHPFHHKPHTSNCTACIWFVPGTIDPED